MLNFVIPGPPFAWKRAVKSQSGSTFTLPEMARHQKEIARLAGAAWGALPPFFGPVKICVIATFETPAGWPQALREAALRGDIYRDSDPDADRILNQVLDGLAFVAFCDDTQIGDARVILRYGAAERTEVWLGALGSGLPQTPASRSRERKWRKGGYDAAIGRAPCGTARWPRVLDALAKEALAL